MKDYFASIKTILSLTPGIIWIIIFSVASIKKLINNNKNYKKLEKTLKQALVKEVDNLMEIYEYGNGLHLSSYLSSTISCEFNSLMNILTQVSIIGFKVKLSDHAVD